MKIKTTLSNSDFYSMKIKLLFLILIFALSYTTGFTQKKLVLKKTNLNFQQVLIRAL